jgi:hypothetical protein
VIDHYFGAVGDAIRTNIETLFEVRPRYFDETLPLLPLAIGLLVGLVLLLVARVPSRGDPFLTLAKGSAIGAVAYFALLPTFSFFRRESALLPAAAVGIAIGADLLSRLVGGRRACACLPSSRANPSPTTGRPWSPIDQGRGHRLGFDP